MSATIFDGMAGRAVFGQLASYIEWEWVASMWEALLLLLTMTPWRRAMPKPLNLTNPEAQLIKEAVTSRGNSLIFLSVFCMFWVFAGYPNYLPFRINAVCPGASTVLVGQSNLGNSIGSVSAFRAGWLAKRFGGPVHVAMIGFIEILDPLSCHWAMCGC